MKVLLMVVCMCVPSVLMAGFYKCKDENGKVVYQSTVCSSGEQRRVTVDKLPTNKSKGQKEYVVNRCVNKIKRSFPFGDPDSLVAKHVKGESAAVIDYMGSKMMANVVVVAVNSRNMYGGYSGYKPYRCYISPASGKVLMVKR